MDSDIHPIMIFDYSFKHWITIKNHSIQYSIQKQNQIIHSKNYSFKLDKTTQLEKTVENRQKRPVLTSKGAFYSFFFWITHFFYSFNNSFNHTAKIFIQRIYSFIKNPKLFIQRKYSFKWKMDYRPGLDLAERNKSAILTKEPVQSRCLYTGCHWTAFGTLSVQNEVVNQSFSAGKSRLWMGVPDLREWEKTTSFQHWAVFSSGAQNNLWA